MGETHNQHNMGSAVATVTLSRRALLRACALAAGGSLLTACSTWARAATPRPLPTHTAAIPATPSRSNPLGIAAVSPRPSVTLGGTPLSGATRPGVTAGEIRLGTWGPQEGPAGAYGVVSRTISAYFASVNAGGGIAGRKITMISQNDSYQPSRTDAAVRKMVERDRVFALVGGLGAQHNLQVLDYLIRSNVPHIAPATGLGVLSRPTRPTIFCVQPTYTIEATLLTRHALDTLGARKPAVFYGDDPASREGLDAVQAELARRGLKAAIAIAYTLTDRNYSAQGLRLQASGADAIILYAVPQAGSGIIQELAKVGVKAKLLASSLIAAPSLFELAGPGIEGLILTSWLADLTDTGNTKVNEFHAWMRANLPNDPIDEFAAAGYAYATLMAELLRRTGADLTRERLLATANALQGYTGSLVHSISYTPDDHRGCTTLALHQARYADKTFARIGDVIEVR
jgi:branched-chain amino acid transport system substrate-binding protein